MLQLDELTYAAIITIELPGMRHPATISLTLAPPDVVETAGGEFKALRDCTLSDLRAFASAMEAALWEEYRHSQIGNLAADDVSAIKIMLINADGQSLAASREHILAHAIRLSSPVAESPTAESLEQVGLAGAEQPQQLPEEEAVPEEIMAQSEPGEDAGTDTADVASDAQQLLKSADAGQEIEPSEIAPPPTLAPEPHGVAGEVTELRIAGLRRPQGHPTRAAVDILINEAAMRDAQAHALSSMDREVAGMLIGPRPEKQPDGRYVVHVTDIIIARHTRMMGASVTYTPESWRYVTDRLHETYPNEEAIIVGWYHTHPGFGIFLSGMDLFIHQNFFTQTWHVALVLDPRAARMGFFCWDRKKKEVMPYDFPWPDWTPHSW